MLLEDIPTTIAVASGKGGVGKTFVSVELAKTLAEDVPDVGLLDTDLMTPDSDRAAGDGDYDWGDRRRAGVGAVPPGGQGGSTSPVRVDGVQVLSKGTDLPDYAVNTNDQRIQLESMMKFVRGVQWTEGTTHLVVDTPPGTGWEIQNVLREVAPEFGFIVTTGTVNSVRDACRTHELFRRAGLDHAVVANMRRLEPSLDGEALRERFRSIDGIDDDQVDSVVEAVEATLADRGIRLHDEDVDLAERFSAPIVADLPFTSDRERVREELRTALDRTGLSSTLEP